MVAHTGSKWNPNIYLVTDEGRATHLEYDSAWVPNNDLLVRLSELTGWTIHNAFEEEQPEFEGVFECR